MFIFTTLFGSLLLWAAVSFAAVTIDGAAHNGGNGGTGPTTIAHTTGAGCTNGALLVCSGGDTTTQTITGCTYNGDALTRKGTVYVGGSSTDTVDVWYLLNPDRGVDLSLSCSVSGSHNRRLIVQTYCGVDQTNPFTTTVNSNSNTGTSNALAISGSSDGLLYSCFAKGSIANTPTADSGQTQPTGSPGTQTSILTAISYEAGAGDGTTGWTWTNNTNNTHVAFSLNAADSGPPPPPPTGTTIHGDVALAADCTVGNYSIANRDCTGADGNAYNTVAECINALSPGDTCRLRGGDYAGQKLRHNVEGIPTGTSDTARITITAYPGENPVIRPTSGVSAVTIEGVDYITWDNVDIDCGDMAAGATCLTVSGGADYVEVLNSEIFDADGICVNHGYGGAGLPSLYMTFRNNHLHGCANSGVGTGIGMYISTSYTLVENNLFEGMNSIALQIRSAFNGEYVNEDSDNNTIRYNVIRNATSGAANNGDPIVTQAFTKGTRVYGNIIYQSGTAIASQEGITLCGTIVGCSNNWAYNNTIFNMNGAGGESFWIRSGDTASSLVSNNIARQDAATVLNESGGTVTFNTNLCDAINAAMGCTAGDPGFVDSANGNFALSAASSPAYLAGTALTGLTYNSTCGNPSIGAYQPFCVATGEIGSLGNTILVITFDTQWYPDHLPTTGCSTGWSVEYDTVAATISSAICPGDGIPLDEMRFIMQAAPTDGNVAVTISYDASTGSFTDGFIPFSGIGVGQELFTFTDRSIINSLTTPDGARRLFESITE